MNYLLLISLLISSLSAQAYHSFYDMIEMPKDLAYHPQKKIAPPPPPAQDKPQEVKDISLQEETIRQIIREELQTMMKQKNPPASTNQNTQKTDSPPPVANAKQPPEKAKVESSPAVAASEQPSPSQQPIEYFDHKTGKMVQITREEFNKRLDKHLKEAIHH